MKKAVKAIVLTLLAIIVVVGGYIGYQAMPVKKAEVENITVDTTELKIGIMGDNQLANDEKYAGFLEEGLELFKEQNVDMIINVGDITDTATKEHFAEYSSAVNSVFPDKTKPVRMSIMGNHDYWLPQFIECWEIPLPGKMQRRFMSSTDENSPWTHKVVNGYHFIGASPTFGSMGELAYEKVLKWTKEQIEIAIADNPNNPVFVLTHNNPQGTVYMSDDDGCENLNQLFDDYPQVVSLSGHSHASLMDEESIYQKNYTAISTQCLSYVCYAESQIQLSQDEQSFIDKNPMAMILTIKNGQMSFARYAVSDKKELTKPWIIDFPSTKENFQYTTKAREANATAPIWTTDFSGMAKTGKSSESKDVNVISFTAANHPDYVKYYQLSFTDATGKPVTFTKEDGTKLNSLNCVSDYTLPTEKRSKTVDIKITEDWLIEQLPTGKYTVNVTATSSFSKPSEAKTFEIDIK